MPNDTQVSMTELSSDTVLTRAPSLSVDLGPPAIIRVGKKRLASVPNALAILEEFAHPIAFSEAVKNLSSRTKGTQAWIELVSSITSLYKAGVLVDESGTSPSSPRPVAYAAPLIHVGMLDDKSRTNAFLGAITDVVKPGDVVVDIGTGTGILALGAARAGARHVYAIEGSEIGRAAKELFAANGFADRITLVPGWSTHVELPEKANVLVSEMIGNDPLEERIIEIFADARARFLAPDARVIPRGVRVLAAPVEVDQTKLEGTMFTPERTREWRNWYGFDFEKLVAMPVNESMMITVLPHKIRSWPMLSEPVLIADLDFAGMKTPVVDAAVEVSISRGGVMGGLLLYFELDVAPGWEISTSPQKADEANHWAVPIRFFGHPKTVKSGEKFKVAYTYGADSHGPRIEIEPS
ncbi:MAG: 50S ribosomal protein L11 methyltransferase [Gemmatimonadaceae bacterium]